MLRKSGNGLPREAYSKALNLITLPAFERCPPNAADLESRAAIPAGRPTPIWGSRARRTMARYKGRIDTDLDFDRAPRREVGAQRLRNRRERTVTGWSFFDHFGSREGVAAAIGHSRRQAFRARRHGGEYAESRDEQCEATLDAARARCAVSRKIGFEQGCAQHGSTPVHNALSVTEAVLVGMPRRERETRL